MTHWEPFESEFCQNFMGEPKNLGIGNYDSKLRNITCAHKQSSTIQHLFALSSPASVVRTCHCDSSSVSPRSVLPPSLITILMTPTSLLFYVCNEFQYPIDALFSLWESDSHKNCQGGQFPWSLLLPRMHLHEFLSNPLLILLSVCAETIARLQNLRQP